MATLTGSTIASSYEQLLSLPDGGGNSTTLVAITDGDAGTTFCLQLATTKAMIEGSGSKLFFSDEGGEHISGNGSVLSIAAGSEIDLTATAVDLNGTLDVSGNTQLSGTVTVGVDDVGEDVKFFGATATNGYMLWDESTDDLILGSSSKLGIGIDSPSSRLHVFTNASSTPSEIKIESDGGNSDAILIIDAVRDGYIRFDDSGTTVFSLGVDEEDSNKFKISAGSSAYPGNGDKLTIDSSGNVGIGTAAPDARIEVVSGADYLTARFTDTKTDTTDQRIGLVAQHYTAAEEPIMIVGAYIDTDQNDIYVGGGPSQTNAATAIKFFTGATTTTTSGTLAMTIDSTGNVGIGETLPLAKLDITSDATNTNQPTGINNAIDTHTGLFISSTGNTVGEKYGLQLGGYTAYSVGGIFADMDSTGNNTSGDITFDMRAAETDTALTEVMRITHEGNVGIGETAPSARLQVTGSIDNDWSGRFENEHSGGYGILSKIAGTASDDLAFQVRSGSTNHLTVLGTGNVGIGTASPESELHIKGANNAGTTAGHLIIDSSTAMAIDLGGSLSFGGVYHTNGARTEFGSIAGRKENGTNNNYNSYLAFYTRANEASLDEKMRIDSSGNVGIGDTSPDAHLDVEDLTITSSGSYTGIASNHTVTAGDGDATDDFAGINSSMTFNDSGESFGYLYGGVFQSVATTTAAEESSAIYGVYVSTQIAGSTDVENIYGTYIFTDVDAGTVDDSVYGSYVDVDIESGMTLSNEVFGSFVTVDCDTNPSVSTGFFVTMNTNADWSFRHYDGANSTYRVKMSAAGQIDAEGTINASQSLDYAEYFESSDGSVIPVGTSVKLDSGKIVACSEGDTPLGVIRPASSSAVVGGGQMFHWKDRFDKDDYGADVWEDYILTKWSEEITHEEYSARGKDETGGVMGGQVKDEKVEGSKAIEAKDAVEAVEAQDAVYETVTKQRQKVVVIEVEEEVSSTEVVLEDGKYVQKTTTKTVTKEVETPQYEEVTLYDEDGEEIGTHQVPIMEDYEEEQLVSEAVIEVVGIAAVEAVAKIPDTYFREHKYHSDRLPEGVTAPDDAEVIEIAKQRQKLNPDFDEALEYVPREERDEWHIVGLLGQIPIIKGQPTGNWVKMKDVSDSVEMYFVK